jgi:hypothetical protein
MRLRSRLLSLLSLPVCLAAAPFDPLPPGGELAEVAAVQKKAEQASAAPMPAELFAASGAASPPVRPCRLFRLGPPPRFVHDVMLTLRRVPGATRPDGFAVDAELVDGAAAGEAKRLPFFYEARGQLVATLTLPPPRATEGAPVAPEQPGSREEFLVWRYLPVTREIVGEWQRLVGPNPDAASGFAELPRAALTSGPAGAKTPYASYLRVTAYMLCREPLASCGGGATSPCGLGGAGSRGSGGTRHPGP